MQEVIHHHSQMSDIEFIDQVFLLTIDPKLFNHEAHIRFAWLVLRDFEFAQAQAHIHDSIKGLDQKFGNGMKYHLTMTHALIEIINNRIQQHTNLTQYTEFIAKNQDLIHAYKALLLQYYTEDLLFDSKGRQNFVNPNRLDFG